MHHFSVEPAPVRGISEQLQQKGVPLFKRQATCGTNGVKDVHGQWTAYPARLLPTYKFKSRHQPPLLALQNDFFLYYLLFLININSLKSFL